MPEPEPTINPRSRAGAPVHRGPRDGRGVVAAQILRAARVALATNGYATTSLRSVARDAGVDPALVTYYFKSKSGLLDAALVPPEQLDRGDLRGCRQPDPHPRGGAGEGHDRVLGAA